MHSHSLLAALCLLPTFITAQLSGSVGPTTSLAAKKAKKVCNISSYGYSAGGDVGPAIQKAWQACSSGGVVVVPAGKYNMGTFVTLSHGTGVAIQIDGVITRTGSGGGNMIAVEDSTDIDLHSTNGKGAVQGNGYQYHAKGSISGPRILRFIKVTDFTVHDFIMTDAPAFHFSMDTCKNGEVYNIAIRGANEGGLDGIDVWSDNVWIHDVEVTNKDECVTVKSPAHNILIENIYCNWSGGSAFGSLGSEVDISDVVYRNVYSVQCNQMMMIKSNGGSGKVSNVLLENFIGHGNAYSLDVDQYWSSMKAVSGSGVQLENITFSNWKGTAANGLQRGPIKIICADGAPCTDITLKDVSMWTDSGSAIEYTCRSAHGSGACLKSGGGAYSMVTQTIKTPPSGYQAPTMPGDLKTSFGTDEPIPIPTLPASYFPGVKAIRAVAGR